MGLSTAQCKTLLFARKKEQHFGHLMTFWFGTYVMLFMLLGVLFFMETLENESVVIINAYKFTDFFDIIIYCVSMHAIPTYRVYRLYDIDVSRNWSRGAGWY